VLPKRPRPRPGAALLAALLLAGCAQAGRPRDPVSAGGAGAAPAYTLGEQWIRSDGVYDLVRADADGYVFSAGPGQEVHLTRTLALARVTVGGRTQFSFSPPAELGWPLRVGASGSSIGSWGRLDGHEVPAEMAWQVEAREPVQVPAGEFDAYRIAVRMLPRLPSNVAQLPDAEAGYRILTGPASFKKETVLLLTDRTERKPTYRNLKWALGTFLARSARREDTVLVYFAGHGAPEIDPRGVERDGLAKYLVPADADPEDLYASAVPMDELLTVFSRIEAERVVAFLDTCYSGAAGGRTFASRKTRAASVDDLFIERLTRSRGRAIVTASRPAEVSIELPELGHGLFTYCLVQGLQGAADGNRDGIVSLQELYEYVEREVSTRSRRLGGNQHPIMKGEMEGPLPLVQVGTR
jgi:hypothetical protein